MAIETTMENKQLVVTRKNDNDGGGGGAVTTYFFTKRKTDSDTMTIPTKTRRLWQIFPSVCACLTCIPFGLMLGWASPTYPNLLQPSSPIPISLDQSAMIAGFLMIGNSLGTPWSSKNCLGAKYGITVGIILMTCGWIAMWQARNIYWLLGSRLLVGLGHGFGVGQLKKYIEEMCEDALAKILIRQIVFYTIFGMIVVFCYGPFVDFRRMSMIAVIVTVFILFLTLFLPCTPRELLRASKLKDVRRLLVFLKPDVDVEVEMGNIRQKMAGEANRMGFLDVVKDTVMRKRLGILAVLVTCQQFTGPPATIVYTQILFEMAHFPFPQYFAMAYIVVFFIASWFGVFVSPRYNKKYMILGSSVLVSVMLVAKICVIVYEINELYWSSTGMVVMIFYIIFHTVGLGNIPFTMVENFFPPPSRNSCSHFIVILASISALIVTKIFQVLIDQCELYVPFSLFLATSLFCCGFTAVFVPKNLQSTSATNVN